jgi:2'-5' RNA ligase
MAHYLIEFRFQGKAKSDIKRLIYEVDKKCRIGAINKKRPVPHITLVAPFKTKNEKRLISDFYNLCNNSNLMTFKINGFNVFKNNRVLYLDIIPCDNLDDFRWKLSQKLKSYCTLKLIDYNRKYNFHSTIALKLSILKFKQVKEYILNKPKPKFKHIVTRVTLLKNSKILREYDFLQKKMFDRRLAKNKKVSLKTGRLLKKHVSNKLDSTNRLKIKSIWNKIKSWFK